jgi:transcriptional regulator with XRE-family HTH domain
MRKSKKDPRSAKTEDIAIGKRIRQRRNEQRISQSELGETLGVSFQQIQKYEKGLNRVGAARLVELATALKCEVGFFLPAAASNRPNASSVLDDFVTSTDGLMIAQAFVRIGDTNLRRMIARFVDGLSRNGDSVMQAAE